MTEARPRLPSAILGAGGIVGQHFARLLADHPWFAPPTLVGSPRSAGRRLEDVWLLTESGPPQLPDSRLIEATPAALAGTGIRVVFSALPSGRAGAFERRLVQRGVHVFTNASDHRMEDGVPLLVPEVNAADLALSRHRTSGSGLLVANPNCSATGLALALAPVLRVAAPEAVYVSTYQALSGAGFPGVASLQIVDNVLPYIPGEEEKISNETRWILGRPSTSGLRRPAFPVVAQAARVGVTDGHLEAVTVRTRRTPALSEILRAWARFAPLAGDQLPTAPEHPILLRAEADRPQPLRDRWAGTPDRARGMAATIGRVRWDPPYLRFFVLTHNAVRGGAGGSVLNAELAFRRGLLPPASPR